ncbi:hypothetical protein KR067_009797, partial [Drosophila pandora]
YPKMQFYLFLALVALFGMVFGLPAGEVLPKDQPVAATNLEDVADLGGQHATEGDRSARWLWKKWGGHGGWGGGWSSGYGGYGGGWNRGYGGGWRIYKSWW